MDSNLNIFFGIVNAPEKYTQTGRNGWSRVLLVQVNTGYNLDSMSMQLQVSIYGAPLQ